MTIGTGAVLMAIGAGIAVGGAAIGSGIGVGIVGSAASGVISERSEKFGMALVFTAIPQTQAIYGLLIAILILQAGGFLGGTAGDIPTPVGIVAIGAGLAVGLAGFSAIGQGIAAASGVANTAEKPEMFGKGVVFSAVCETQAIYGLLIAVLMLALTGILSSDFSVEMPVAIGLVGAGLAVGLAGFSAIGQGITCSSGIAATARNPGAIGRSLVFAAMSETFAIFGLLVAILILFGLGLFSG
ncbi:MAG: V-type ATP synthase subunit K [Methanomicrobiales archaeon]|nr:V-type ATP synthase subunit K [Methanomicrobiales archaeon]